MQALIARAREGELSEDEVAAAAAALLDPETSADGKAAFLEALHTRGETPAEIAAFARVFLDRAVDPELDRASVEGPLLDVCGTGGDRLDLFNVSTTSMFILAGGGAVVVKHGNRGITSKSGGADVLEELGVRLEGGPAQLREAVRRAGVGFLFAPHYHPAFRVIAPVRQMLAARGQKSMFNLLGPLLNPARPDYQLVGVFDAALTEVFATILRALGRKRAWAVHGTTETGAGVDEMSTMGPTRVTESDASGVRSRTVRPADAGLPTATHDQLRGGDAAANAGILQGILAGTDRGPRRDLAVLNAAAGFVVAGLAADLAAGRALAEEVIDSGRALARVAALRQASG